MEHLSVYDYAIMIVYFSFLVALGFYFKKRASTSIENYFLGNRQFPWWALGISGMASMLDLTGTMVIVSFLFMMGPRGLFIEFRGGAVLVLAVMMLWSGKWHRRSGCMTKAEWMIYRFGNTPGGHFARVTGAIAIIIGNVGTIAYLIKGTGLFMAMFLPMSPQNCAVLAISVATIYILSAGFYGVVYTDLLQSGIIAITVVVISLIAFNKNPGADQLGLLATQVTGQTQWMSSVCNFHTPMPKGYENYSLLFLVTSFYLFRNVIYGMGEGGEPRYFAARNDRECGKMTFLWINLMSIRWPMVMAFAVLGLFMIRDFFPDQQVLMDAAAVIKSHIGHVDKSHWAKTISSIINTPEKYPLELSTQLRETIGTNWRSMLHLLSYEGTVDSERILPAVILYCIPKGFRGLVLVAFIAASLSTFGTFLNWTTSFFSRDLYQAYFRKNASNSELIKASWIFGFLFVAVSLLFAYSAENINDIWDWLIMAMGGGLVVPNILRFYWWRFNGGGFAVGTIAGLLGAIFIRVVQVTPDLLGSNVSDFLSNPAAQFFGTMMIGLSGAIIGTYCTKPNDREVLEQFYRTTRPFGFWKPLVNSLNPDQRQAMRKEHVRDVAALPFALTWQISLFLLPMQLIIKNYKVFWIVCIIFVVSLAVLYLIWVRHLWSDEESGQFLENNVTT